jgi:L-methionine (R)-S-oxide reductase
MTPDELVDAVATIAIAGDPSGQRASRIASAIRDVGDHRWVGVYEVTEAEVAILGYAGPGAPAYPRFARTQGLTASAVTTGRAVIVDDVTADPRYLTAFGTTRSEMIVPVLDPTGTTVIGTIDVESERVAAFSHAQRELVERFARAIVPLYAREGGLS